MRKVLLSIVAIVGLLISLEAQVDRELIQKYLIDMSEKSSLTSEDVSDWEITDSHVNQRNGIQHVYIRQTIDGIPVENGLASITIKNGKVAYVGNRFISELKSELPSATPSISPELSIGSAAENLAIQAPVSLTLLSRESNRKFVYSNGDISLENIPVELMYYRDKDGQMHLVWDLSIYELSAQNWWSVSIDAHSGELLNKVNWVSKCEFGHVHSSDENYLDENNLNSSSVLTNNGQFSTGDYRVFELPTESPNHGPYVLVTDPDDSTASPFGWHDDDGLTGADYTITRGNNVHAYEDRDGSNSNNPGTSPDGTSALQFDFPYTPGTAPNSYTDAAVTNLFYMNNVIHDVWYYYGFDEASGNFQENNYGRGGIAGDYVRAEAQDGGGTNNANFATPPDGNRPRMQMYLWGSGNSARDGDFDNGIIVHEYGHGISNRLTGGPSLSGCLSNDEQMGEGWSDWFAIMMTIDSGDQAEDVRGIGTFAQGAPTTSTGIRPAPYSTDFAVNNYTYANSNSGVSRPHGVGFVFATVLWDLNWALIDEYGGVPDPDLYTGSGGNNIAMNLIMEGLKIQPCSPGMIDGRDAILAADSLLYNGLHQCLIWEVFANRGFGFYADQGDPDDRTDQTEDFTISPNCLNVTQAPIADFATTPQNPICGLETTFIDSSQNIAQQWFWDLGDGTTTTDPRPKHLYANPGTYNVKMVVSNGIGTDSITKTVTIGQLTPPVVNDVVQCPGQVIFQVPQGTPGTIEWLDLNLNVLRTGPLYNRFFSSDEIILVRRVTNGAGPLCISQIDTVNINILNSDFTFSQAGSTINFTDASSNATSWFWEFGDGNTSTLQNPSHDYGSSGTYTVRLTVNNGQTCANAETINVVLSGIDNLAKSSQFNVFPNPSQGSISISLNEIAKSDLIFTVQDLQGKVLIQNTINKGQKSFKVNLNEFKSAMYLIKIESEEFTEVRKLMLEK